MDDVIASDRETINRKLRQFYDGKIVRKDLTKHIKEGANVLSMFWNTFSDSTAIRMMRRS